MKKYLMTGMAAIAFCAAFTSCSKNEDLYDPGAVREMEIANVYEQFNQAFIKTFGQVHPDQDWGFGNGVKTRSANTEHNQWAAVDNIYKLLVPPALTPGQKQRVKVYFQYNRYLTYEDPHLTDFFVQQVYEGSTDPGTLSSEVYTSGNGASVKAGDHMDKLTVGVAETHVNDFNSADCGESTVLNNGTKQNDYVPDGTTHQDKITLMLGESTEYVGFWCSEGSVQHNDCCALAGADVIDAWAASDEAKALGIDLGEAVVDGWDRSFVGLDYEQMKPDDCFTSKWYWNGSANVEKTTVNVWDFCSDTNNTHKVMLNGQLVDANTVANDQLFFPNGQPVKWVKDDTNMYLGQNLGTNQNTFNKQENGVKYYDLDAVYACINQGAYPKQNNMEFIKGLGGRDYIFSDWIVTLTPAKKYTTPPPSYDYDVRIMAEDLNATAVVVGDIENSDWDYNDVVFDVKFTSDGGADITLVAAGGVLPLEVAGVEVHKKFGFTQDPKTGWYPMINTNAANGKTAEHKSFHIDNVDASLKGKDISIVVYKKLSENSEPVPFELTGEKGKPAAKFAVQPGTPYCNERVHIDAASNGAFSRGVENGGRIYWGGPVE